jgi:hypothetical protein
VCIGGAENQDTDNDEQQIGTVEIRMFDGKQIAISTPISPPATQTV